MGQQACCCVHQECGVPCCELAKRYKQHAPKSVYRHATERTQWSAQEVGLSTRETCGEDLEKVEGRAGFLLCEKDTRREWLDTRIDGNNTQNTKKEWIPI